ncbi:MAG: hypothetical protein JST33_07490 [Actinobacteria bacterium]|nr:hypothetical protein [Actinomycetota bacterium]
MGVVAVGVVLVLSGCSAGAAPSPAPSAAPTASAGAETVAPSAAPVLHPEGSAEDNLPLFAAIVAQVWAGERRASGRAYVDALTAAGFARADMQVTADESTVGNPAESIQFSVRWGDGRCLVGQVGPSTRDPVTAVLPQLGGGRCLVGRTASVEP